MRTNNTTDKTCLLQKGVALLLAAIFAFGVLPAAAFTAAAEGNGDDAVMGTVCVDALDVYAEPCATAEVLEQLAIDTRIEILEQTTADGMDWGRIDEGWVDLAFVSLDEPVEPADETPEPTGSTPTEPPVTETPATEPPATEPPASEPPASEPPASEPPASEPPATEPPATEPPASEPPASEPPASEPPASEPPASEPPASEPPASEPPASEPPASEPPASEPPASEPPATEPPATEPPATEPPATEPPATEPPATEPPATEPPVTEPEEEKLTKDMIMSLPGQEMYLPAKKKGAQAAPASYAAGWGVADKGLNISKTATARGDGTYDLQLTLQGDQSARITSSKVDLVIIIDRSNSMKWNSGATQERKRLEAARDGANSLIDLLNNNSAIDARYRIMEFSGSGHSYEMDMKVQNYSGWKNGPYKVVDYSGWYTSAKDAQNRVNKINVFKRAIFNYWGAETNYGSPMEKVTSFNGEKYYALRSTNYEAAFRTLNGLGGYREDALRVVVFLTDGNPTVAWSEISGTTIDGNSNSEGFGTTYDTPTNVSRCLAKVEDEMLALTADRFYALGFGEVDIANLNTLARWAKKVPVCEVVASSMDAVVKDMTDISGKLEKLCYSDLTIVDELSHNENGVKLVDVTDDATIKVTVKQGTKVVGTYSADGKKVTLPKTATNAAAELTAKRSGDQLSLEFPDGYKLEPDYTYILSAVVKPTEAAYREYRAADETYIDTPDSNTGTHANEKGIYSNDGAAVTYDFGESKDQQLNYRDPVVQLDPGKLVITKQITGLTAAQIEDLGLSFEIVLTYPAYGEQMPAAEDERTITLADMTVENGIYSYTITGLSPDTDYTVTETFTMPDGYRATTTVNGSTGTTADGTVPKGQTKTVAYNNAYELDITSVKVEKQVTGNMGDTERSFAFTASISGKATSMAGMSYVIYTKNVNGVPIASAEREITTQTVSFSLKDDEYCIFYGVPMDANLQIKESPEDYILTKVEATNLNGTELIRSGNGVTLTVCALAEGNEPGHTVTFTNDRTIVIETGISLDSLPYVLILVGVAVAGIFLFLRRARRFED